MSVSIPPPRLSAPSIRQMTNGRREEHVWHGPDTPGFGKRRFQWKRVLWSLVYPSKEQRVYPTVSGVILISLAMAIGTAAYNTSNNILFITLSLLLSCLLLSGVLSWLNLAKVAWRLKVEHTLRVGVETLVVLEVRNRKRFLPTYGLRFEVKSGTEQTLSTLTLKERLDPQGGRVRLEWVWKPAQRGAVPIELMSVGSLFPFGFLRKHFRGNLRRDVIVWPAPVTYQRFAVATANRSPDGRTVSKTGQGGDLFAVRPYAPGDSHRLIHWKATARVRQLLVRQFAAESQEGFSLWLDVTADQWSREEQFELLLRFVASLAEDLFRLGRLNEVTVGQGSARRVRRVSDVESFLDELAVLQPAQTDIKDVAGSLPARAKESFRRSRRNLLTFAPDGTRGVAAYLDGQKAAST
ncbi:MAG TPA: DUF58 domain-containing protein [Opitutaceae bacterium]|nr:DUF58 domain-containing protein [Opitutaceae bacterium]